MEGFEELKDGESVSIHLIAGAAAGVAEHCGLFPIDTIKVFFFSKNISFNFQ